MTNLRDALKALELAKWNRVSISAQNVDGNGVTICVPSYQASYLLQPTQLADVTRIGLDDVEATTFVRIHWQNSHMSGSYYGEPFEMREDMSDEEVLDLFMNILMGALRNDRGIVDVQTVTSDDEVKLHVTIKGGDPIE